VRVIYLSFVSGFVFLFRRQNMAKSEKKEKGEKEQK